MASSTTEDRDFSSLTEMICQRLAKNARVRRTLPGNGRIRIDRQLPFLCIYRKPPGFDGGTRELITTEAAYAHIDGVETHRAPFSDLCRSVAMTLVEHFGQFLFVEIWSDVMSLGRSISEKPAFRLYGAESDISAGLLLPFQEELAQIDFGGEKLPVVVEAVSSIHPPAISALDWEVGDLDESNVLHVGVSVPAIYHDSARELLYPLFLRVFRKLFSGALRKAIGRVIGSKEAAQGKPYHVLGPSTFTRSARLVDQELSNITDSFDFLLQITPVNLEEAWTTFVREECRRRPNLRYRQLAYDPRILKRKLLAIPIERVDDVTLYDLFIEKQDELGQQLTALADLETPSFLFSSMQIYGTVDSELLMSARQIIDATQGGIAESEIHSAPAEEVLQAIRVEIDFYHRLFPAFHATVELSDQIASSVLVSGDRVYLSRSIRVSSRRIASLLHHEIGTHVLTYVNGRQQPFRQLSKGLAAYDALQEGLAVLAEYLTGGLGRRRMRTLAARVLAVHSMTEGASFSETYSMLLNDVGLHPKAAFAMTVRVYRAGGLTKDALYLRGLVELLRHLKRGHDLEPLYVGKIGFAHFEAIQELRRRSIIHSPAVLPRFWQEDDVQNRLEQIRGGTVLDLLRG